MKQVLRGFFVPVRFKVDEDKQSTKLQNLHLEQQMSNSGFQEVLSLLITATGINYFQLGYFISHIFLKSKTARF